MALNVHHHAIDRLAVVNGFISGIALYPQVYVVLANGSAAGVSWPTFGLILINSVVWLLYALHRSLASLAIASLLNIGASGILLGAILFLP